MQPSGHALTLNRVGSGGASRIDGNVTANGNISNANAMAGNSSLASMFKAVRLHRSACNTLRSS